MILHGVVAGSGAVVPPLQGNAVSVAVSNSFSEVAVVYKHTSSSFGQKYSIIPPTTNAESDLSTDFHPNKSVVFYSTDRDDIIWAMGINNEGFTTKFTAPATLPTFGSGGNTYVKVSPSGNAVIFLNSSNLLVQSYAWTSNGWGTKNANAATNLNGTPYSIDFSQAGTTIAISTNTTPFLNAYAWTGSTVGTKYANPASIPPSRPNSVHYTRLGGSWPHGDILLALNASPFIAAYSTDSNGQIAFAVNSPSSLPPGAAYSVHAQNFYNPGVALAHNLAPFVSMWEYFGGEGWGTRAANPASSLSSVGRAVRFSADSSSLIVSTGSSPFIHGYSIAGAFGTKFSNPVSLPVNSIKSISTV